MRNAPPVGGSGGENDQIVGELEEHENGKFAWIMDPEGNKIELWEPLDEATL